MVTLMRAAEAWPAIKTSAAAKAKNGIRQRIRRLLLDKAVVKEGAAAALDDSHSPRLRPEPTEAVRLTMRHGDKMHPVDGGSLSPARQNLEVRVKVTAAFCLRVEPIDIQDASAACDGPCDAGRPLATVVAIDPRAARRTRC